jgi:hypothetical protein
MQSQLTFYTFANKLTIPTPIHGSRLKTGEFQALVLEKQIFESQNLLTLNSSNVLGEIKQMNQRKMSHIHLFCFSQTKICRTKQSCNILMPPNY